MGRDFHVFHVRSSAGMYGAEYVILGLMPALARRGIDSTLLCLDNHYHERQELACAAANAGLQVERVPCRRRFDLATIAAIRRCVARHPRAILHVHDYKSALNGWLARSGSRTPVIATSHGQFSTTARLRLYHRLELALMSRFDRVCIVSAEMRPAMRRAGVAADAIRLVENGIDTERFRPDVEAMSRHGFGIAEEALLFGAAMRLSEQKNPLGLIDAFARVGRREPRAELVVAGEGPLRAAIVARATAAGLGRRVHLIGAQDELHRFYPMLDVFVLPSLYEGLPLALLEAMAAGCRIAVTAVGQIPAVLQGLAVVPVAPDDPVALAEAMLLSATQKPDPGLRTRVRERYSTASMADAYTSIYAEAFSEHERAVA